MAEKLIPEKVDSRNDPRFKHLVRDFETKYGSLPAFIVRVPGRVNLIGEHIDYCGYSVFPMAISQDILVAVLPTKSDDSSISLSNFDPKYDDFKSDMTSISITRNVPNWHNYFLCGVKGIIEHITSNNLPQETSGMQALVSGSIPPSAGLSSSSALVCAAAIATAHLLSIDINKKDLADLCAKCERYIGTEGGGMDQAIAILANAGHAKLIDFEPLRATDALLPKGCSFVIAHSLAELNKAATDQFNCRVMECRLAAKVLAKLYSLDHASVRRLIDLQNLLEKSLPDMALLVKKHLHDGVYTKQEIAELLEMDTTFLDRNILSDNTRHLNEFKLRQRALHVFEEANRVLQFKAICDSPTDSSAQQLGQLMFDSHLSCRDLYECSHPQLDSLVEISRDVALGARLTGAGWGGCIVAMVQDDKVDQYLNHLKEKYYTKLPAAESRDLSQVVFPSQPGAGASIYLLDASFQL